MCLRRLTHEMPAVCGQQHPFSTVWDDITCPFPNFNGTAVHVWEWISNFNPHFARQAWNDLSILGGRLIHFSKRAPVRRDTFYNTSLREVTRNIDDYHLHRLSRGYHFYQSTHIASFIRIRLIGYGTVMDRQYGNVFGYYGWEYVVNGNTRRPMKYQKIQWGMLPDGHSRGC